MFTQQAGQLATFANILDPSKSEAQKSAEFKTFIYTLQNVIGNCIADLTHRGPVDIRHDCKASLQENPFSQTEFPIGFDTQVGEHCSALTVNNGNSYYNDTTNVQEGGYTQINNGTTRVDTLIFNRLRPQLPNDPNTNISSVSWARAVENWRYPGGENNRYQCLYYVWCEAVEGPCGGDVIPNTDPFVVYFPPASHLHDPNVEDGQYIPYVVDGLAEKIYCGPMDLRIGTVIMNDLAPDEFLPLHPGWERHDDSMGLYLAHAGINNSLSSGSVECPECEGINLFISPGINSTDPCHKHELDLNELDVIVYGDVEPVTGYHDHGGLYPGVLGHETHSHELPFGDELICYVEGDPGAGDPEIRVVTDSTPGGINYTASTIVPAHHVEAEVFDDGGVVECEMTAPPRMGVLSLQTSG